MNFIVGKVRKFVITLLAVVAAVACSDSEDVSIINAELSVSTVDGETKECAVVLTAQQGMRYEITIDSDGGWCRLSDNSTTIMGEIAQGQATKIVYLYLQPNYSGVQRVAEISVEFTGGKRFSLNLTQLSVEKPTPDNPNMSGVIKKAWPELPLCVENENFYYRYYTDNVGSKSNVRNYTMCFDRTKKAALWVAYPMHSFYTTGSAKRNDDFIAEPSIPVQYQPNLTRSYAGRYDRGHQIAAADRKCSQKMMDQTFYWTNMTPQYGDFNQKLWSNLEGKVRSEICADTLYVVTGAYFDGERHSSIAATTTAAGVSCPVPTHYYKLMLRTVNGRTGKAIAEISDASQLQAIGLFIQHHDSGGSTMLKSEYFMSVREIEQITGFDFFTMLNDSIEDEVESQYNPDAWF